VTEKGGLDILIQLLKWLTLCLKYTASDFIFIEPNLCVVQSPLTKALINGQDPDDYLDGSSFYNREFATGKITSTLEL